MSTFLYVSIIIVITSILVLMDNGFIHWSVTQDITSMKQEKLECQTLWKELEIIKQMKVTNLISRKIKECKENNIWPERAE